LKRNTDRDDKLHYREMTACPVCHTPLADRPAECPSCGTSLTTYYALYERANRLATQAMEAVTRHNFEHARGLVEELRRTNPEFEEEAVFISARAALYQHRFEEAAQLAEALPHGSEQRRELEEEIAELHGIQRRGMEHFNLALSSAQKGYWTDAEFHLDRALALIPHLPAPWRLAVKLALRQERWELAKERAQKGLQAAPEDAYLHRMADELAELV